MLCPTAGQEYPAVVEFAPFQKTAKKRTKKKDAKCGTIVEGNFVMIAFIFVIESPKPNCLVKYIYLI